MKKNFANRKAYFGTNVIKFDIPFAQIFLDPSLANIDLVVLKKM